jgi:hypothetical protein
MLARAAVATPESRFAALAPKLKSLRASKEREMRKHVAIALIVSGMVIAIPSTSLAKGEITGVIGGLLGGDLNNVLSGNISVGGAFENGPLYGVRLGWIIPLFGLEASYVYSPSGVSLSIPNVQTGVNSKVHYLEGNALWIIIPGPVAPFVTAGAGLHYYDLDVVAPQCRRGRGRAQEAGIQFRRRHQDQHQVDHDPG